MSRSRFFRYDKETGKVVEAERAVAHNRPKYPLACEALAVHPKKIDEAREHDRAYGVTTEYRSDGAPIMRDKGHYKRYRKAHGVHFRNGYES